MIDTDIGLALITATVAFLILWKVRRIKEQAETDREWSEFCRRWEEQHF